LVQSGERLEAGMEAAQSHRRQLNAALMDAEEKKSGLDTANDVTALKSILRSAEAAGPIERQHDEKARTIDRRETALNSQLKRQTLWGGTLEELDTLALPTRESVDQFEKRFVASINTIERWQANAEQTAGDLSKIKAELRKIETTHDIPTEEGLLTARRQRDRGWHLIRGRLEGPAPDTNDVNAFKTLFAGSSSLAEAFEHSVGRADDLADRLRREIDQVTRKGWLEADKQKLEQTRDDTNKHLADARSQHHALETEWHALWESTRIPPRSPLEMRAWLADVVSIRDKAAELPSEKAAVGTLAAEIAALKKKLTEGLANVRHVPGSDQDLAGLIDMARREVEFQESLHARRVTLDQRIAQLRRDRLSVESQIDQLTLKLQQWRDAWNIHIKKVGLAEGTSPAAALAIIETIREAEAQQDEADILAKRINGIDQDAETFRQRVSRLAHHLAADFRDTAPEEAALLLNAALNDARAIQSRREDMQRELETAEDRLKQARERQQENSAIMQSLCRMAACGDPAGLSDVENQVREHRRLEKEAREITDRLRQQSGGAAVDTFVAEAEAVAPDAIAPELARLKETIDRLEQERSELDRTIGTEKSELKRMDGRAAAAEYAEEAEHLLANLETDVAHYARVRIAAIILSRTIENYREKHQAPLIRRASRLFCDMTLNAFDGIRAEYDEKGQPILVALRSGNGELVRVAGMSDGTADQLYLALRLASLEHYFAGSEPLPFIVDDILLRFDDDRAVASLKALHALSRKTQVIFFTHHRHMVNLAEKALGKAALQVHRLDSRSAAVEQN
jgi:uncharacterized protein YhaN